MYPSSRDNQLDQIKHGAGVHPTGRRRFPERKIEKRLEKQQTYKEWKQEKERKRKLLELQQQNDHKQKGNDSTENLNGNRPVKRMKMTDIFIHSEESSAGKQHIANDASNCRSETFDESSKKLQFSITKEELGRIRLSRDMLEKFVHTPFFAKTVIGCFVKVNIATDCQKQTYRIGEIMDVVDTVKVYQLGNTMTNRGLRLKHGSESHVYRLEFVSNQDFSDAEFAKWKESVSGQGCALPGAEHVNRKDAEIEQALNHQFTDSDVDFMVKQSKKFRKNPHKFAMQKTLLLREKESAEENGNDEIARQLKCKITDIEERAMNLDKRRKRTVSAVDHIVIRNRQKNICRTRKVSIEDRENMKLMGVADPFNRRPCAPVIVTGKRQHSAEVPEDTEPQNSREEETSLRERSEGALLDLYECHNFEIDLDI